ncbi:AraC family transcriptional regulator [Burkholderia humptydooensis]|uniref:AraC family transcriptional regulator n=2 Tax=Burkholderia humptydooensis TaxID=430531 RepID=A0A7U4SRI9_9BURK|nr:MULTISPECIES: AraC family transcriptional regulator [Burkholderia]AJY42517.1 helix-turn-helix domain protein [Burkholderia sp. 2002721687]ALX42010.1 AraC family transcriptional regulator [Burkholderia humptydooensis]EIP88684.1 transcriptional regulator, AraC family, putative [Burkholderia humptydooensis MSMB43]QPS42804.1 AraC family transcriptional regulator [Burkholderia humptydooensis]
MRSERSREEVRYWRTPLLPDADFVTATYRDHAFAPHWHDAYTIPVIEAGAERYTCRGSAYVADAGSIPVINPGEIHTGSRAADDGWRYRVAYVPVDFIRTLADEIAGKPQPAPWFRLDVIHDADLAARLVAAHRLMEASGGAAARRLRPGEGLGAAGGSSGSASVRSLASPTDSCSFRAGAARSPDDPLSAETTMLDAYSTLIARHAGNRSATTRGVAADRRRVDAMRERLAADLSETVTLSDAARAAGLSPFHAARLFSRTTGMPPHAWRNQLRLQRALAPLRAGASVADVAAACGFADQSHFTRHFKRMFGVPPGRWQPS